MIDTVEGYIPKEELNSIEQIEKFKKSCDYIDEIYYTKSNSKNIKLKKGEIEFSISKKNIKFKKLSLPNYLYGTNSNNFQFDEVKTALISLENEFYLPFSRAYLTRVDIAWNFNVSHPTKYYTNCFDSHPRFNGKHIESNSLKFTQSAKRKEIIFYDKLKERIHKNKPIKLDEPAEHLLRYEYRLKKAPHKELKLPELTFQDLTKNYIQKLLLKQWYEYYRLINKVDNTLNYDFTPSKSPKKLIENIAGYTLNTQPNFYSTLTNKIDYWYSNSSIRVDQRDQMKAKTKKILTEYLINNEANIQADKPSLINELNSLVLNYFKSIM